MTHTVHMRISDHAVSDAVLRNVALNQPSFQISTREDKYGSHGASLANDGSRQTDYRVTTHGCAASNPATNPWWSVDLGVPTLIYRVDFTSTRDAAGMNRHVQWRREAGAKGGEGMRPGRHFPGGGISRNIKNSVCVRSLKCFTARDIRPP